MSAPRHRVLKDGAGPKDHRTLGMVPSGPQEGRRKRSAESQPKDAANNTRDQHTQTGSAPGWGSCVVAALITATVVVVSALTPGHEGGEECCWPSSDSGQARSGCSTTTLGRRKEIVCPSEGDIILSPAWKSWLGLPIPHQQHSCAPCKV